VRQFLGSTRRSGIDAADGSATGARRAVVARGVRALMCVLAVSMSLATASCWRYGFAGGGLPSHVKSLAILPFENQTATPELQKQLWDAMRSDVSSRLGVHDASESRADAVLKGTILRYDVDVPVGYSATGGRIQSSAVSPTERKLELALNIEIDDQTTGKVLWKRDGLVADGNYPEGAELSGRKQAIKTVVQQIIEGAQSQW